MRLFRRAPRSRFPAGMLPWLETFGRHWLDSLNSRVATFTGYEWQRVQELRNPS